MTLLHGGDTESFVLRYGYEPIDFSASCSPLGVPAGVRQAICQAAARADAYPDPLCRRLRLVLAQKEGVLPEQIWCGNGSADLIFRLVLARKPHRALVLAPTFAEYERSLQAAGCKVIRHGLAAADRFMLTDTILEQLTPDLDLLFLCNPNNPTGQLIEPGLMQRILDACAAAGILLVVDECFNGLVDEPERHSVKDRLNHYPGLVVIKAFTKLYGLAGLRLGYCLSQNQALLASVRDTGQPWAVSSLAQAAGLAALADSAYVAAVRKLVREEKIWLQRELAVLPVTVIGGDANWLFFHTACTDLAVRLRAKGLLIRDCSNLPGLVPGYFRIAVRTHTENNRLVEAMKTSLQE
jgi:threonine-phosphate decarboxylase